MNNFPHHKLSPQAKDFVVAVRERLTREKYGIGAHINYVTCIRRFLASCQPTAQELAEFTQEDLSDYLDTLKLKRRSGVLPNHLRRMHRAAIRFFFETVRKEWPQPRGLSKLENGDRVLIRQYDEWMDTVRGLRASTRKNHRRELRLLLRHIRERSMSYSSITLPMIDAYLAERMKFICRHSKATVVGTVRGVLSYLHGIGLIRRDFSCHLHGPRIYTNEGIPTAPTPDEVAAALKEARRDRTIRGLRDCAMFELLAAYGMRVGELIQMRLDDIDWAQERLRIRHDKTGISTEFPLFRRPANALVRYLRNGRPRCAHREIFIRLQAPYRPLAAPGAPAVLWRTLDRYFGAAGVRRSGRRGAHSIRHARAVSLLRKGASLKTIGDVLGHRAAISTMAYLKLATEDLRAVALDSPTEVQS